MNSRVLYYGSLASLLSLLALCLAWEIWLAPLRPGGSWMMLKALPLLAPLFGLLAARRKTYQWTSFLSLAYFAEGVTRAFSERGVSQGLAGFEILLSLSLFTFVILAARALSAAKARAAD